MNISEKVERAIVAGLIRTLAAKGFSLAKITPQNEAPERVRTESAAMDCVFEKWCCSRFVLEFSEGGWVHLVPGNGEEIISDYSYGDALGMIVREFCAGEMFTVPTEVSK